MITPSRWGISNHKYKWNGIRNKDGWEVGKREWYTVPCLLSAAQTVVGSSPEASPMLVDTSTGTRIKKTWLPSQQVLHQRWIWGSHKWESVQGIYPGFETQGRHHQKSKTGVSVAPWKGLMSSKNFFKKSREAIKNPSQIWCINETPSCPWEVCISGEGWGKSVVAKSNVKYSNNLRHGQQS